MTIRHTAHARYDLWYHVAWSTKYRKQIWKDDVRREQVVRLFREIAAAYDMAIDTIQLMSDHIHLLLSAPPRMAPSRAVQILKSVSTKHLFQMYPDLRSIYWGGEVWVAGYFVRSVGPGLTKEHISAYIEEQAEEI